MKSNKPKITSNPANSFASLAQLWRYAHGFRGKMLLATACSIVNKILDIMPEILIGIAIDVVIRKEDSFVASLGITDPFNQILLLGLATFLVWAGESLFEYFYLILWRNIAQELQHEIRIDAYGHIQTLDLRYYDSVSTGNLIAILNDDINQLERFFNGGANSLIQTLTAVVLIGGVFFVLSPIIALVAFIPIPIIILGAFYFQQRAQPLYKKVREKVGSLNSRLADNLLGIQTIKSFTAERYELDKIECESSAYVDANRAAIAISSAFIPIIRMAILAGFLATLIIGGWLTLQGKMQIGSYGVLVFLTQRLLWPLTGLAEVIDLFERAMASSNRILKLLQIRPSIADRPSARTLKSTQGHINFSDVSFSYRDNLVVIRKINLQIDAGSTVAFVGPTGSGKSTLIKLLMRFYEPDSGTIELDFIDIRDIALCSLRQNIGLVAQDTYLFPGTIEENIAYSCNEIDPSKLKWAANIAGALEFIHRLPHGMQTLVGERGQRLSGGQRQRLSIARAIYKNPSILILDEATSSVDNETEAAIQDALNTISEGRTTLIVAHRLSTIVNADTILVMDQGQIVASGTHQSLLTSNMLYHNLWKVQTGIQTTNSN